MQTRNPDPGIDEAAAAWVAREDRAPLADADIAERERWLRADSRHLGAYARARAVYVRTDRAAALAGGARERPHGDARRWLRALGVAAALAAGVAVVALGVRHAAHSGADYATRKGEVLRVPLPDGSTITLDSDSAVDVAFDATRRGVRLKRGAAVFDVAKNRELPFVVDAAGTSVTAVGTSFLVSVDRQSEGETEVLVREGIVDVADVGATTPPARLPANFKASARKGHAIEIAQIAQDSVARQLAWRDGMLSFNGDTLQYAADQFARYSDVHIIIDEPALRARRIVGLYSANDPVGFAHSVAKSLNLVAERRGNSVHLFGTTMSAQAAAAPPANTAGATPEKR
ncbi:MAG: FecR domain-containing protein [Rudaea sp.]|uniref:FecR family protein n=1 Tax=unclassified Rudaea TaxID=2627037 RepID=UPI0010FA0520|nr:MULTISPECIES: FecR domain-containing protein [unclassified Rudaea]MBN8887676.1 FecR domain-containing protein [Rudaea sp.]